MSSPGSTCEGFVLSGSGFSTIDFTSLYYNPIITSTTTKAGCSPYINPRVSLPAELTSVDPLWKRCEPLYYGAFDPPRVISKTNALSPHNGQAGRVTKAQTNECPTPPPKPGPLRGPDKPDATQAPESTYLDSFDQVHCSDIPQGADKPMTNSQPGSGGQKQAAQPDHKPEASPTPLNGVSQVPAPAAPKVPSPPQNPPQPKAAPTPPMQGSPDQHIAVSKEPDNTPAQPNLPKAGPAPSNVAAQKQQQVIPESSKLQSNPPPASPQPANPPPANPPPANPPRQPSTPNTPAPNPTRESEPLSSQEKSHSEPKGFPKDSTTPDNPQPLQASSTKSKDNGHVQQPAANQAATASDLSQQPKTGPVPAHKSNQIENFVASMASELAGGSKKPAGTEKPETSIHPQSARESQVLNSPETPKTSIGASPIASPKSSDILDDSPRIITSGKSQAPIDRHLGSIEDLKLSHNTRHPTNPGDISILRDMTSDTQNDEHTPKTSQAPTITDNHTTVGDFEFLTNLQTHTSSKSTKPPDDASTTMPSKTIVEEMSRKEKESSRTQTTQPLQQTLECINKAATSSQEISHRQLATHLPLSLASHCVAVASHGGSSFYQSIQTSQSGSNWTNTLRPTMSKFFRSSPSNSPIITPHLRTPSTRTQSLISTQQSVISRFVGSSSVGLHLRSKRDLARSSLTKKSIPSEISNIGSSIIATGQTNTTNSSQISFHIDSKALHASQITQLNVEATKTIPSAAMNDFSRVMIGPSAPSTRPGSPITAIIGTRDTNVPLSTLASQDKSSQVQNFAVITTQRVFSGTQAMTPTSADDDAQSTTGFASRGSGTGSRSRQTHKSGSLRLKPTGGKSGSHNHSGDDPPTESDGDIPSPSQDVGNSSATTGGGQESSAAGSRILQEVSIRFLWAVMTIYIAVSPIWH